MQRTAQPTTPWQRNTIAYVAAHGMFATPQPCGGVYVYMYATQRTAAGVTTHAVRYHVPAGANRVLAATLGY